jgi:hypothetical protein
MFKKRKVLRYSFLLFSLAIGMFVIINLYAEWKYDQDEDAFLGVPDVEKPINRDMQIAQYTCLGIKDVIYLQRYTVNSGYRFLFYKPMNVSDNFVLDYGYRVSSAIPR